jgi:hypothetical protein
MIDLWKPWPRVDRPLRAIKMPKRTIRSCMMLRQPVDHACGVLWRPQAGQEAGKDGKSNLSRRDKPQSLLGESWREHVKKNRAGFLGRRLVLKLFRAKECHYVIDHHHLFSASTHRT